jgi:uncharacterized protein (TIGR02001 family)
MRKIIIASVVAGAFALPAFSAFAADAAPASPHTFTGNVTLATEYNYRGISQTNGLPAIQGGFDYSHASGLYVGVWGSNISWISDIYIGTDGNQVSAPIELDVYGGYKGSLGGDWTYDVGVLTYNYPTKNFPSAPKADTTEVYGAIGWKWLSLKYSTVVSNHIFGWTTTTGGDTSGSDYIDLTGTLDLGNGWGVSGHVGHQKIKDNDGASYSDYKIGVTKDVGFGTVGLNLIDTNAKGNCSNAEAYCWAGRDQGKSTAVLTFSKTL